MNLLLTLPIIIPLAAATGMLLWWTRPSVQRIINVSASTVFLFVAVALLARVWQSGIQATQLGSWPAPYGITLVADLLSAIMLVLAAVLGLAVAVYSITSVDGQRQAFGYHPLYQVLLLGIAGSILTGDLFNLYVWFEVMLISSFALLSLGGTRPQMEASIKYVTLNLLASALLLAAVGIVYGLTGTLNMADLAAQIGATETPPALLGVLAMLFLLAFGIKAAIFPLFFWLPGSYHTASVAVSAIFAGLLTKIGGYAMLRVYSLLFAPAMDDLYPLLITIAGLTMVIGVLGAAAQQEFRRVLSFHIISQIGYLVMGLALFTPLALAGAIFFLINNILAKANLFLVAGVVEKASGTGRLYSLGGFYRGWPFLAVVFLISALSLAGLPPLPGFWAKFLLVSAGIASSQYLIVAVALGVSLLTLFSMTKIWTQAFWKERPDGESVGPALLPQRTRWSMVVPAALIALLMVGLGLAAEPVYRLTEQAAAQLLEPAAYIDAVLGPEMIAGRVE